MNHVDSADILLKWHAVFLVLIPKLTTPVNHEENIYKIYSTIPQNF
jgi:diketogulonate reductase-like aldo/keto reductase